MWHFVTAALWIKHRAHNSKMFSITFSLRLFGSSLAFSIHTLPIFLFERAFISALKKDPAFELSLLPVINSESHLNFLGNPYSLIFLWWNLHVFRFHIIYLRISKIWGILLCSLTVDYKMYNDAIMPPIDRVELLIVHLGKTRDELI